MKRRTFLAAAGAAATSTAIASQNATASETPVQEKATDTFVPNRIAVSTYSFFTFKGGSKL